MKIGILGFGNFGQFLAKRMKLAGISVVATSRTNYEKEALELGVSFFSDVHAFVEAKPDVILISTSILSLEYVVKSFPWAELQDVLVIDVLSVKSFPKEFLKRILPNSCDILCTHPMFGPESGKESWWGLPFVFEHVRVRNAHRAQYVLDFFKAQGCSMIEMSCEEHDSYAASTQFVTHTTGRMLSKLHLRETPIDTKGYMALRTLIENTEKDSMDLYFGLYHYNNNAPQELERMEDALMNVKNQLFERMREGRPYYRIGIQGGEGSFNHQATLELIEKYAYKGVEIKYLITSEAVLQALNRGQIDFGVFAIENSGSGTVLPSVFSMSKYPHEIIEIHHMPLTQCLLVRPGYAIEKMKKIITHPQAIKQCQQTLTARYPWLTWDFLSDEYDTADCAKRLSLGEFGEDTAVIASRIAADKYHLSLVEESINDDPKNTTSFIFCKRRQ